jgi:hypothetical protein
VIISRSVELAPTNVQRGDDQQRCGVFAHHRVRRMLIAPTRSTNSA